MLIEVCASNIQSALAAQGAGAHRIELCTALDGGGLTPSAGLLREVLRRLRIGVHVLIRPREGNFCYDDAEMQIMLDDIRICRQTGAHGVVIGALDTAGRIDIPKMQAMLEAAAGLDVTCHRAFDYTADPLEALETLIDLGFKRVLSSGQAVSAYEGRFVLQKMVERAAGRIIVMPGAGLSARNIREVAGTTGALEFHLTGRKKIVQPHPGGEIPGLEWWYWESREEILREAMAALA
ncbi:MAG: copper homeostasis protein CutC [Saprospirales bacterium]|nr:copper homeostasis protein CutC [Saprospirales bacterium]MBK8922992.1 copper homeostasis protein CutC [Saprospirales bacterium]